VPLRAFTGQARDLPTLSTFVLALVSTNAHAAGFQHGFAADPDGKPLQIGVWYPSQATPQALSMGPTTMTVAVNAAVAGSALPLVVMSHGTGGSFLGHYDTAIALADFSKVLPMCRDHPGDFVCQLLAKSEQAVAVPRDISTSWRHAAAHWRRWRPPSAPAPRISTGRRFTGPSTPRWSIFSAEP